MKKLFLLIALSMAIGIVIQGKRLTIFTEEYFKNPLIRVDDKQIYIVDQEFKRGVIYDKSNFKKVAKFGSPGEGPGEFRDISNISIDDRYIYVTNFPKLSVFSKQGELINELKYSIYISGLSSIGDNFIGYWIHKVPQVQNIDLMKIQFTLYDSNMKKKKDLLLTNVHKYFYPGKRKNIVYWIRDCFDSFVFKNRVYIGTTEKGFHFSVYDKSGNKLYEINRNEKRRKVTEEEKRKTIESFRVSMSEEKWKIYKAENEIEFCDYYPAYKAFFVNDDRIYVFCFPKDYKYKIFILDLKGNIIKKGFCPIYFLGNVTSKYNHIHNGKIYQLKESMENWELDELDLNH